MTETIPETVSAAAARVAAYLDVWESTDYTREMTEIAGGFGDFPVLTVADLRVLLAAATHNPGDQS